MHIAHITTERVFALLTLKYMANILHISIPFDVSKKLQAHDAANIKAVNAKPNISLFQIPNIIHTVIERILSCIECRWS